MTSNEIREKFIKFYEEKGHTKIEPSPLVLENDPTTLFTSAGMQPLVPYLKGEKYIRDNKELKRLVDSQPCIRMQDIEEVGDNRHTTFFEMLGNWSLGSYFKEKQLPWIFEFLTSKEEGVGIDPARLYVSVFEGTKEVPKDEESIGLWKELLKTDEPAKSGIDGFDSKVRIYTYPAKKNWWSMSGIPEEMPVGEIGGPDSEIFYDFDPENKLHIHENSLFKNEKCHLNCDCGRFLEFGNSVFIQYIKQEDGALKELPQKNVDFGGGLERITAVANNDPDIFKIDLFLPVIKQLEDKLGVRYESNDETTKDLRIIADHIKASVFLIADGVRPSNKKQDYILRKLLRRSVFKTYMIKKAFDSKDFRSLVSIIVKVYPDYFKGVNVRDIEDVVSLEIRKFRSTVERGFKEFEKHPIITGKIAFDLYQSYGYPVELTEELAKKRGQKVNKREFDEEFNKHKELSRTASAGMFKGGLSDKSEEVTKLHTATHLLHAALRKVLGEHVSQKGSNITAERLRFDFSHPQKLTDEELKKVESLVNEQIDKDLPVSYETKSLNDAIAESALHFFTERYGDNVKVYTIGDRDAGWFSKEICGGPHVSSTGVIGRVKIFKQEKVGSGIVRIYATTDSSKLKTKNSKL